MVRARAQQQQFLAQHQLDHRHGWLWLSCGLLVLFWNGTHLLTAAPPPAPSHTQWRARLVLPASKSSATTRPEPTATSETPPTPPLVTPALQPSVYLYFPQDGNSADGSSEAAAPSQPDQSGQSNTPDGSGGQEKDPTDPNATPEEKTDAKLPVKPTPELTNDATLQELQRRYGEALVIPSDYDIDSDPKQQDKAKAADQKPPRPGPPVTLADVEVAVDNLFPLLSAVELERAIAEGNFLNALGAFDTRLIAAVSTEPTGFYRMHRYIFTVEQPVFRDGSDLFASYRLGRGSYPNDFDPRETNDGGEFSAGFKKPLLQSRDIDKRRAELLQRNFDRQLAEPTIAQARIQFYREAAFTYWDWVTAGLVLEVNRTLLRTATDNLQALRIQVRGPKGVGGRIPAIVQTDRERSVLDRMAKVVQAELKFQQSAYKLALFFRRPDGIPMVPGELALPETFPNPVPPLQATLKEEIELALQNRPELRSLDLQVQQLNVDVALAQNQQLAKLDLTVKGSQDVGQLTSSKGDKREFELFVGVEYFLPLQLRAAIGKERATRAKINSLQLKRHFTVNKIETEVRLAISAIIAQYEQIGQRQQELQRAREVETAERRKLEGGRGDIFLVIQREQVTADTEIKLLEALRDFHSAIADYEAAMGFRSLELKDVQPTHH